MISILVTAGSETTAMGGTFALRSLLRHPHELAKLRADRSLLQSAVNEILRFDFGDGGGIERFALRDVELRGVKIRKGQKILLSLGGAHRDPQAYPDPDRFDIERDNTNLIMLGLGPRYCLGANLARQEMRFIIDAALDFLPEGARLCEDQIRWGRTGFSNRMETLPVDFGG